MPVLPSSSRSVFPLRARALRSADRPAIATFVRDLPAVDPLAVVQAFGSQQPYFYWETGDRALAAFGTAAAATFATERRFQQTRAFVARQTARLARDPHRDPRHPARFFCSFAFAARPQPVSAFPAALVFLPRHQLERAGDRCTLTTHIPLAPDASTAEIDALQAACDRDLAAIADAPARVSPLLPDWPPALLERQWSDPEQFVAGVEAALRAIAAGDLQKVVLARTLEVLAPLPLHPFASIARLRRQHPDCHVFSVGNGRGAHFLGASPERLLAVRERQFVSDALAGSSGRSSTPAEDRRLARALLDSAKERHEHDLVCDFICQQLRQLDLDPRADSRQVMRLANIQHLWTPVRGVVPADFSMLDAIARLHPTPAVAGVPSPVAQEHIARSEGDRGLYAGPIGWTDSNGDGEFVVGIRSAELCGQRARLHAGAGIVAGSDPHRELAEVELKLQAMLRALT